MLNFIQNLIEFEATYTEKIMDIDNKPQSNYCCRKVTKKLEDQIFNIQAKTEDQNNRIAEIFTALSKLKATLQEVTLLRNRIQTPKTVLQAREND